MSVRYLDPTNDVAFKRLFSNKERLISLLNSILQLKEGSKINELDYIPLEQMPLFKDGKRSIFDLKVKDQAGRWYIIEMQRTVKTEYINRVQFYGSYSYINQIEAGISHTDLLPVVVISIIGEKIFPNDLPCINYHQLKETTTNKQYLFSLTYVFVELAKFDKTKIETDIDQWLHLLKCAHGEDAPPESIASKEVLSAYDDLEQYKWTASEHDAYIRAKLAIEAEEIKTKEYAEAKEEIAEAKEEIQNLTQKAKTAKDEGVRQGIEQGIEQNKIDIAKIMLSDGDSIEKISKITGLGIAAINELKRR